MSDDSRLSRLRRRLGTPIDAASLAVFRIVFGVCVAWDATKMLVTGQLFAQYVAPPFHFSYPLAPVPLLDEQGINAIFLVLSVAGGLLALGLLTRAAAVVVCLGLTWWFLLDEAAYLNHRYLMCLLAFLLIWVPAGRVWSLDSRLRRTRPPAVVPAWTVMLLRGQMLVVYSFAGVAKLNADWLRGAPLDTWLSTQTGFPVIGRFIGEPWMVLLIAWGGMLFDLSIGWLLLWGRTRSAALVAAALFHVCNHFWFDIGVFPFLAMGASLIFCKPDWPRRFTALLRRMTGWQGAGAVEGAAAKPGSERAAPGMSRSENGPPPVGGLVTVGLVSWLAVQLLLPLRHWLYPGNVDWTEEGHRFSWQMMLRDKGYELRGFRVLRPDTDFPTTSESGMPGELSVSATVPDGSWRLQPVADPLPPLYPLPLPLQAACDPEWAATIEESSLDQLMMERLSPREQAMLGIDPAGYAAMQEAKDGETVRLVAELDRALTHRALWGILQHARRLSESESSDSESKPGDAAPARLLTNLHRVARDVFEEVDLEVPDHQIEQLLVGAEEFDRLRLAGYQAGPMLTRPYMLRQYAHHVADRLERVWGVRPHVSVDLEVSLNMRPFEPIVDPGLDLASLPFSLRHAEWIEPLAAPLPSFEERRARRLQLEESGYFIE